MIESTYTVYSVIDYDMTMGSYRRKIRLIECNDKCRYLNKLTCKGICGRCFICLRPPPLLPPLTHMYIFSNSSLQSLVHKFKSIEGQHTFISCPGWAFLESDKNYSIHCDIHISISYDRLFKGWVEVGERMLKCR